MNVIAEVRARRQKLADVLDSEEYSGIREIVEELYPDQAHFLFELLQNAQDTRATEVTFELQSDSLIFEHNGRSFNQADVEGITNIGKGTKRTDEDTIGRFGVGFKAVFAYSETPAIYSPTFSFAIEKLVLPREIEPAADLSGRTRFVFPFNNPKKEPRRAFEEVAEGLQGLGETSLLFLSSLECINWKIAGRTSGQILRIQHSQHHIEILRQRSAATATSMHFLRFEAPVDGLEKQSVAVAYPLKFLGDRSAFDTGKAIHEQMKVSPAEIGQVAVFFPAEKETSGLRFHLHAPFVPELSRASVKETPANAPLFAQLAKLSAHSLYVIKDLGLLNAEFLGVLPNNQDSIPKRYEHIRRAIVTELNESPLTPTQDRSHAPAKNLRQSKASLKEVISDDDLSVLVDYSGEPPRWAASAPQKNSNADRMFSSLSIKDWDLDELVDVFYRKSIYSWLPNKAEFDRWLKAKPDDWLQQLYSLLYREHAQEGDFSALEECAIIKLKDGTFSVGRECYFPSDVGSDEGFPRVDPATYSSGKSKAQQLAARRFLEEVGVRHVGETELVESILDARYSKGSMAPRPSDLRRFVILVEKEPSSASVFRDYHILETQEGKWAKPSAIYLDEPFVETGLRSYYQTQPEGKPPYALASRYEHDKVSPERIAKFAIAVGSKTQLDVKQGSCSDNPNWTYLWNVPGERYSSPIDRDYFFAGFKEATKEPSLAVSRLLWTTLDRPNFQTGYFQAVYRKNRQHGSRTSPSRLTLQLKQTAWIPQQDGPFVKPADARSDLLPPGFPYDPGKAWLRAIGFGDAVSRRTEEARQHQVIAEKLGFQDAEALADAQWFAALDPEARRQFKEDLERRAAFEMPELDTNNPDRRATRVAEQAEAAPPKQSEQRTRSVSIGVSDVKVEAEQYLRRQYTNNDGIMICQVCKAALPFKLADGHYYVEKVEFITTLTKRHYQNYLALCPNHAAMYQHAHGSEDIIRDMLLECGEGPLDVILAGRDETIYFTQTHLVDLRAIVGAEANATDQQAAE